MKTGLLILMMAAGGLTSLNAAIETQTTQTTNQSTSIDNTPGPRKPGNAISRYRNNIFTVNVHHFNRKIKEKHLKEVKALFLAANKKTWKERRADRRNTAALATVKIG